MEKKNGIGLENGIGKYGYHIVKSCGTCLNINHDNVEDAFGYCDVVEHNVYNEGCCNKYRENSEMRLSLAEPFFDQEMEEQS